jgi:Tol biopolymer transport system component
MSEPVSLPPSRTSTPTFAVSATPSPTQTPDQTSPTAEISAMVLTPTSAMQTGKIVFEVDVGEAGIYTIKADGSELSPIYLNGPYDESASPKWTADGAGVVFRTSEGNDGRQIHSLWIMDEGGTDRRRLTYKNSYDYDFSLSPDGNRIVYASKGSQPDDSSWMGIFIVEIQDGKAVPLTSQSGYLGKPMWSPDGKKIAYLASNNDSDAYDLYLINESGNDSRKINGNVQISPYGTTISWAPDSKSLATICFIDLNTDICIFPIDGTAPVRLTSSSSDEEHPSWSPDGRSISYVSNQIINSALYVDFFTINVDDLRIIKLTDFPPYTDSVWYTPPPIWSPNGDHIAIVSQQGISSNHQAILLISLNNNEIIKLTPDLGLAIESFDWVGDPD